MANTTGKVIYDSVEEYFALRAEFEANLPRLIKDHYFDMWTYSNAEFGVQFSNRIEPALSQALSKLTKGEVPEWTKDATDIFSDAIRGIAKSVSKMAGLKPCVAICSNCGKDDEIEMQEGFENRKICNIMCVGLITNVLFDTEAREVGGEEWGLLRKVRLFKCPGCEKLTDELFDEKVCIDCDRESE